MEAIEQTNDVAVRNGNAELLETLEQLMGAWICGPASDGATMEERDRVWTDYLVMREKLRVIH